MTGGGLAFVIAMLGYIWHAQNKRIDKLDDCKVDKDKCDPTTYMRKDVFAVMHQTVVDSLEAIKISQGKNWDLLNSIALTMVKSEKSEK